MEFIKFADPGRQFIVQEQEIVDCFKNVAKSGNYILGHEVQKFENAFAEYIGVNYCVGVASGTDALILGMLAIGIEFGDEVLVPSLTATATVAAIEWTGATPVFVDIAEDMTIDSVDLRKKISSRTKAIIAVHLHGGSCDLESLQSISEEMQIPLIEDCAQSCGAEYKSKKLGSFGLISCFSFYPTKNLGALGDAGAILTNDFEIYKRIIELRQYGWDAHRIAVSKGRVSRLDELQAAILNVRLKYVDKENLQRQEIAKYYNSQLQNLPLGLPLVREDSKHVFHLYVVKLENRDLVKSLLENKKVGTGIHYYPPVHENPHFKKYLTTSTEETLERTSKVSRKILSLPMHPYLSETELSHVVLTLTEALANSQH